MPVYPRVLSEAETMRRVLQGASLSRFGDGEWKMCRGGGIKSQEADPELTRRLCAILRDSGECLVGVPYVSSASPKQAHWAKQCRRAADLLPQRTYGSAFVSRPDSAPWINTSAYWALVQDLWRGQDVTLVRGSGKAFTPELLVGARQITEILGPRQHAWTAYGELMERIGHPAGRVLLSLGPTATVMAVDLCAKGVQAVDVGHMGAFYRRWLGAAEAAV